MPEGPEVRVITRQLNKLLGEAKLKKIHIIGGPYKVNKGRQYETFRMRVKGLNKLSSMKVKNGKWIYLTYSHD